MRSGSFASNMKLDIRIIFILARLTECTDEYCVHNRIDIYQRTRNHNTHHDVGIPLVLILRVLIASLLRTSYDREIRNGIRPHIGYRKETKYPLPLCKIIRQRRVASSRRNAVYVKCVNTIRQIIRSRRSVLYYNLW